MSDEQQKQRSATDSELEREIREGRKFSLEEAIGRLAGPGALKGESPIPRLQQAQVEIDSWLGRHMIDHEGALKVVLHRYVKESDFLLSNLDAPLIVLAACCKRILESELLLNELTRAADVEWGRTMGERPFFQKQGAPPHLDDPYAIDDVSAILRGVIAQIGVPDK